MSRAVTVWGYAVLAVTAVALQIAGLLWRRTPTLGQVQARLTKSELARSLLLAGWLWLGWHTFVRGTFQ